LDRPPFGLDRAAVAVRGDKSHHVFKFSSEGKLLVTLGKTGVAGDGPGAFNQPTHVFVGPTGDIFLSEGVRLEFLILSLNPGLRQRCVAPDV
jgi:hypothetical protein